jgi:hypothetical protein
MNSSTITNRLNNRKKADGVPFPSKPAQARRKASPIRNETSETASHDQPVAKPIVDLDPTVQIPKMKKLNAKKSLGALGDEVIGRFADAAKVNPPLRQVWKEAKQVFEGGIRVARLYVRRGLKLKN